MSAQDNGGPAFPLSHTSAAMYASCLEDLANPAIDSAERAHLDAKAVALSGMTLRDAVAKDAMKGAISGHISYYGHDSNHWRCKDIADFAYEMADAMLEARK